MIIVPVGLIMKLTVALVRMTGHLIAAFFRVLLHGSAGDRVFVLLLIGAPVAGFQSVRLWQRLQGGRAPAVVAAPEAPSPAAPSAQDERSPEEWTITSADGTAELRHAPGCRVKCLRDGRQVWEVEGECEGTRADLRFVSNDCVVSATFFASPAPAAHRQFIQIFRLGRPERAVLDMGLTRDKAALASSHLIAGMHGNPGEPPHYSSDGDAVEFGVVDGTASRVPLVQSSPPPATARKKK